MTRSPDYLEQEVPQLADRVAYIGEILATAIEYDEVDRKTALAAKLLLDNIRLNVKQLCDVLVADDIPESIEKTHAEPSMIDNGEPAATTPPPAPSLPIEHVEIADQTLEVPELTQHEEILMAYMVENAGQPVAPATLKTILTDCSSGYSAQVVTKFFKKIGSSFPGGQIKTEGNTRGRRYTLYLDGSGLHLPFTETDSVTMDELDDQDSGAEGSPGLRLTDSEKVLMDLLEENPGQIFEQHELRKALGSTLSVKQRKEILRGFMSKISGSDMAERLVYSGKQDRPAITWLGSVVTTSEAETAVSVPEDHTAATALSEGNKTLPFERRQTEYHEAVIPTQINPAELALAGGEARLQLLGIETSMNGKDNVMIKRQPINLRGPAMRVFLAIAGERDGLTFESLVRNKELHLDNSQVRSVLANIEKAVTEFDDVIVFSNERAETSDGPHQIVKIMPTPQRIESAEEAPEDQGGQDLQENTV